MKLTKNQFCTAVNNYKSMLEEERQIANALDVGAEWKCAEWIENYYELLSELSELEEDPDIGTDLDWFCFGTNFGQVKDYCKIFDVATGRTWRITTPEILYDYITRND